MAGDKPINTLDAASLIHDIEYAHPRNNIYADMNMVKNLYGANSITTPFIAAGMALRTFSGYQPPKDINKYKAMRKLVDDKGLLDGYNMSFSK